MRKRSREGRRWDRVRKRSREGRRRRGKGGWREGWGGERRAGERDVGNHRGKKGKEERRK